jgi:Zn-dependent peptidase ImmA (M78 family)
MPVKVPFLREEQIERDAEALLADFELARSIRIVPPVPIEDIIEKHLKIRVEFDELHEVLGVPRSGGETDSDILGAIFFDDCRIVIDASLDPEENPTKEARYRFTLAHEGGGHWRLHRHLFAKDPAQSSLFYAPSPPSVVCRSSQAKEPIEWQADCYAGCLLMPRRLVFDA